MRPSPPYTQREQTHRERPTFGKRLAGILMVQEGELKLSRRGHPLRGVWSLRGVQKHREEVVLPGKHQQTPGGQNQADRESQ